MAASRGINPETTMYVTATAYDTIEEKLAEVVFEGLTIISQEDLSRGAASAVAGRACAALARIEITLGQLSG
jgi:hypothetical protein